MAKIYDLDNLSAEECAVVLARRAYQKQWRDKNKDKVKAATTRFWLKEAQQFAENADADLTLQRR